MPKISTLIQTKDSELTIGRTLETLRAVDEIVVVDHRSRDETRKIAKQYGAKVIEGVPGVSQGAYSSDCSHDWVLCLLPNETLSEALEASLLEWKAGEQPINSGFAVRVREQDGASWKDMGAESRLVNKTYMNWVGATPVNTADAMVLEGDLLRFPATENA